MSLGFKHDPLNFPLSGAPTITELPVVSSAGSQTGLPVKVNITLKVLKCCK